MALNSHLSEIKNNPPCSVPALNFWSLWQFLHINPMFLCYTEKGWVCIQFADYLRPRVTVQTHATGCPDDTQTS